MPRRRFAIYGEGGGGSSGGDFPDAQTVSIDFNGTDESLGKQTGGGQSYHFGISYTLAVWIKPRAMFSGGVHDFMYIQAVSGGAGEWQDAVKLSVRGDDTNDPLTYQVGDTNGVLSRDYRYEGVLTSGQWHFIVVQGDYGATGNSDLYLDGVLLTPTTKVVDLSLNFLNFLNSTTRVSTFAGNNGGARHSDCLIHSAGIWDAVLASGEVLELYKGGNGKDIDWASNGVTYSHSADLNHWWRMGHDSGDIGADHGTAAAIDIMVSAENISAADIVADAPS